MFDLIILLDGTSYYNRNKLMSCLGLQQQPDINGDEQYVKQYTKEQNKQFLIASITKGLSGYSYDEEEIITVPYDISGVCHLIFYPFREVVNELLSAITDFNSELYVDDDHGNIVNICDYKILVKKKKVYPYTYCSKDYF